MITEQKISEMFEFLRDNSPKFRQAYELLEEWKYLSRRLNDFSYDVHDYQDAYFSAENNNDVIVLRGIFDNGNTSFSEHDFDIHYIFAWEPWLRGRIRGNDILRDLLRDRGKE